MLRYARANAHVLLIVFYFTQCKVVQTTFTMTLKTHNDIVGKW